MRLITRSLAAVVAAAVNPRRIKKGGTSSVPFGRVTTMVLATIMTTAATGASRETLSEQIERARQIFEVPGAAIVIVRGDQTVLAQGWGIRGLTDPRPVDANTLFSIGSCSKAFTAAALSILVDQGKLEWDQKVVNLIPGFSLGDPYTTAQLTLRDLLAHRSGLGNGSGDFLILPPTTYSRAEVVRRIRYLKPAYGFRERFAYNNLGYVVAGRTLEVATGVSWESFVRTQIFAPLKMKTALVDDAELLRAENKAQWHARVGEFRWRTKPQQIDIMPMDQAGPAGSVAASVTDLARWLKAQLALGVAPESNGTHLWSEIQAHEMRRANIEVPIERPPVSMLDTEAKFRGYSMGWFIRDVAGRQIFQHGGGVPGQTALVAFVPGEGLAFAVVANIDEPDFITAIYWSLIDRLLKLPSGADRIAQVAAARDARIKSAEEMIRRMPEQDLTPRGSPLSELSSIRGKYQDEWFGEATLTPSANETFELSFASSPTMHATLTPAARGNFVAHWALPVFEDAYVTFWRNPDGTVAHMQLKAVSPLSDVDYSDFDFVPAHRPLNELSDPK